MAFQNLGVRTLNFKTGVAQESDSFIVTRNTGYVMTVNPIPNPTVIDNQYVLLIPKIKFSATEFEYPLKAKYYPKGPGMVFTVATPDLGVINGAELCLIMIPKATFRSNIQTEELSVRVRYNDVDVPASGALQP